MTKEFCYVITIIPQGLGEDPLCPSFWRVSYNFDGQKITILADLPTSQITKVYFATPKSVFFTQKVYFTSKSQKDTHYPTFKHKNKL